MVLIKELESKPTIEIVDFEPKYKDAYKALNEEWISRYFKLEETDYIMLENPQDYVIKPGGYIFVALYKNKPVGVCALVKSKGLDYDYELAKMAVSPFVQGKKIGFLLGQALIAKAESLGAKRIYLESNTLLKPAINLYYKLGFVKIENRTSKYERVDIQMELLLS
jgi:GNAT superfamily N-acetyltransferase